MSDKAEFFYTTNTPHQWSSGPVIHYWNGNREIESLEEAKALAEQHQVVSYSDDAVDTTYGVTYRTTKVWHAKSGLASMTLCGIKKKDLKPVIADDYIPPKRVRTDYDFHVDCARCLERLL